jgi:ribosomal protein S18 acetylase RimI-like enzyme
MLDTRSGPGNRHGAALSIRRTGIGHGELHFRALTDSDIPAIEQHFLALAPHDRQARFLSTTSDEVVIAYARELSPSHAVLIGAFDPRNVLIGLAEAHTADARCGVDLGVSVDAAFRRRGIGRRLVARAVALAFARGARSAHFNFAPTNGALSRLVQSLGARVGPTLGHASIDRDARAA